MSTAVQAGKARADVAHAPKPYALVAVAVLGCVAGATTMTLALTSDHASEPALQASLLIWIILSYIFSGLVAWWRRPESRFGPLMVAAGFRDRARRTLSCDG